MAAEKSEVFELSGAHLGCYKAGHGFGVAEALNDAATNLQGINRHVSQQIALACESLINQLPPDHKLIPTIQQLPRLTSSLEGAARVFANKANEHAEAATQAIGTLKAAGIGLRWWHHPQLQAAVVFVAAVVVATLTSTVLVFSWMHP